MSDFHQFRLICDQCNQITAHLVWCRLNRGQVTGLPYVQCYRRCLECGSEHPTVKEAAKYVIDRSEVAHSIRASADSHSNFGTEYHLTRYTCKVDLSVRKEKRDL